MSPSVPARHPHARRRTGRAVAAATVVCALAAAPGAHAAPSAGRVAGKLGSAQSSERSLRSRLSADRRRVAERRARVGELEQRLGGLQATLDRDQSRLDDLQGRLRTARANLVRLRAEVVRDQEVLADQLVAVYETPRADLVNVVLDAQGFQDLVSRVDDLNAVARRNAQTATAVRQAKEREAAQTATLTTLEDRAADQTRTALSERDAVAHVKLQVAAQEEDALRARDSHSSRLATVTARRKSLQKQLNRIQREQLAAGVHSGGTAPGAVGFFLASGTDYSYGDEPKIAQRLEKMAVALHLHLIGLSGHRTPQHSVEVGGFANDPHTRGEASDTPGLEGVPEATLNRFGLTRPFAGAAEADHVQLKGSI